MTPFLCTAPHLQQSLTLAQASNKPQSYFEGVTARRELKQATFPTYHLLN